jgi:hypothetical protein
LRPFKEGLARQPPFLDGLPIGSSCLQGDVPRVLAVLNSFLLAVLDFLGVSNVPRQMRIFDAQPLQAVRLLLSSLLTFK